jgi:hypothetical protein
MLVPSLRIHAFLVAFIVFAGLGLAPRAVSAQGRDPLLNGAVIGAAVGAASGVAFAHVVRDSDLSVGQYAYGALVFGALGAGVGVGVDALLSRALPVNGPSSGAQGRVSIAPTISRQVRGVLLRWRW